MCGKKIGTRKVCEQILKQFEMQISVVKKISCLNFHSALSQNWREKFFTHFESYRAKECVAKQSELAKFANKFWSILKCRCLWLKKFHIRILTALCRKVCEKNFLYTLKAMELKNVWRKNRNSQSLRTNSGAL